MKQNDKKKPVSAETLKRTLALNIVHNPDGSTMILKPSGFFKKILNKIRKAKTIDTKGSQ